MIALHTENIKDFMRLLFKSSVFDKYEIHGASVTTFTSFEISGSINSDFYDKGRADERKYCTWEEIRPFIYSIIKGSKLPKQMKIVLAAYDELLKSLNPNASALFINIIYENGSLNIITGCGIKTFSLDKSYEFVWDTYVSELLEKNNIFVSTHI